MRRKAPSPLPIFRVEASQGLRYYTGMKFDELMREGWREEAQKPRVVEPALDLFREYVPPSAVETLTVVRVHFDGGTPCNCPPEYGIGYGSYCFNEGEVVRIDHAMRCSANAAEILTIAVALEALALQYDPKAIQVLVQGDSMTALKWVRVGAGEFVKKAKITPGSSSIFQTAIRRLTAAVEKFPVLTTQWKPRKHAVRVFGH